VTSPEFVYHLLIIWLGQRGWRIPNFDWISTHFEVWRRRDIDASS